MKKIILSIFALLIVTANMSGQVSRKDRSLEKKKQDKVVFFGLVGGGNSATFKYTDPNLSNLKGDLIPRQDAGIFMEISTGNFFSIAPELIGAYRGMKTSYKYGNSTVTYNVRTKYASFRVPFLFRISFAHKHNVQPFLFFAPEFSYLVGGSISLGSKIDIGEANMRKYDYGILFGLGLRWQFKIGDYIMLTRFDLGYNIGMANTFSDMEINESSTSVNVNAYNITGTRMNRDIEFNVHISFPSKIKKKGCEESSSLYRNTPEITTKKYGKGKNFDQVYRK